jgi:3',5'-cyclic AMP phosphodiesterase CpdA
MQFTLAHLSDPHLPFTDPGSLRLLNPKQILALLSWRRKRHLIHTSQPLAALLADLAGQAPDYLALTGDVTNAALPAEFEAAKAWLASLGSPERLTLVPGNHDLTRAWPWEQGLGQWAPWLRGDEGGEARGHVFPSLRRRGPVAIIGLSSAIETPVFSAAGEIGGAQLERLEALLTRANGENLFRVVLIHHPPVLGPGGARKGLRDRAALRAVLRRQGAELVLHGHHHLTQLNTVPGPRGPIPVMGVPSASASGRHSEIAGWNLHHITREAAGWRLATVLRAFDPQTGGFRQLGEWTVRLF